MTLVVALCCILLLLYTYVLYAPGVAVLARLRPRPWKTDEDFRPTVSVILPVLNEELILRQCLDSLCSLEYDKEKLEILIGSDGSTDATNDILREYSARDSRVRPYFFEARRGKSAVLDTLVAKATGSILFFIDADVVFARDMLVKHTRNFADPNVVCVAGHLGFVKQTENVVFMTESDYWSWEVKLRRDESLLGSTIGLYGGNFTLRKDYWKPIGDPLICDDLYVAMNVILRGKRLVFDKEAAAFENYGRSIKDEFKRKTRNCVRSLTAVRCTPQSLLPSSGSLFWMMWPHKLLRWFTPFLLGLLLLASLVAALQGATWGFWSVRIMLTAITLGLLGGILETVKISLPILRHCWWILSINLAFVIGMLKFLTRRDSPTWVPFGRVLAGSSQPPTEVPHG